MFDAYSAVIKNVVSAKGVVSVKCDWVYSIRGKESGQVEVPYQAFALKHGMKVQRFMEELYASLKEESDQDCQVRFARITLKKSTRNAFTYYILNPWYCHAPNSLRDLRSWRDKYIAEWLTKTDAETTCGPMAHLTAAEVNILNENPGEYSLQAVRQRGKGEAHEKEYEIASEIEVLASMRPLLVIVEVPQTGSSSLLATRLRIMSLVRKLLA